MGKGRAPCCDKSQVKRGPWSPSEDLRLITFIQKHGHDNWRALPKQAGLLRCGKSCRLRWINYLRPDLKRGNFTKDEEENIIKLHEALGNKWSKIANHFPGRTDNEIKNVWNTHLKKRWSFKDANSHGEELSSITSSSSSSSTSFTTCGKQNIGVEKVEDSQRAKDPREEQTSCSVSSNDSNSTGADEVPIRPEEKIMDSLLQYGGPYDVNNMLQEVNKPGLEIPLEADVDFWNMLDGLDSVQVGHDQVNACESSNFVQVENKKWLCYLENELGLDAMGEENREVLTKDAVVAPENFQCQIFSKPEDVAYFPMWPSWPRDHNSASK